MSIKDLVKKINPVVNFGDARSARTKSIAKIYYGVRSFVDSEEARKYYTAAVIILVGLSSFGLGRLSAINDQQEPISIERAGDATADTKSKLAPITVNGQTDQTASVTQSGAAGGKGGKIVASINGTKYYFPWCASNIADKNKIWFNSESEARAKGYQPAANCKGLK